MNLAGPETPAWSCRAGREGPRNEMKNVTSLSFKVCCCLIVFRGAQSWTIGSESGKEASLFWLCFQWWTSADGFCPRGGELFCEAAAADPQPSQDQYEAIRWAGDISIETRTEYLGYAAARVGLLTAVCHLLLNCIIVGIHLFIYFLASFILFLRWKKNGNKVRKCPTGESMSNIHRQELIGHLIMTSWPLPFWLQTAVKVL